MSDATTVGVARAAGAANADATTAGLAALGPVNDAGAAPPADGIGLCLSGGGYRAMLFHLGALWRLNELGLLRGLTRVSSVSGGSIVGATLGARWGRLAWSADDVAENFAEVVAHDIHALACRTLDIAAVSVGGLLPGVTIGKRVAHAYRENLFGEATLQDLPDPAHAPLFVICATNLESGALFRFARPYLADYRVGMVRTPSVPLADAVAASSAFPPVLSPFELDLSGAAWETVDGNVLTDARWRERVTLADGGVYDNLALETVWKDCATVLISDGGGHLDDDADPPHDWPRQTLRVLHVIDNQVRSLRKRQAVAGFSLGQRRGTYWGIRSAVADYDLPDALAAPPDATRALAATPTRLAALGRPLQERLVNWGYTIGDTALRRWVAPGTAAPARLPYPDSPIG